MTIEERIKILEKKTYDELTQEDKDFLDIWAKDMVLDKLCAQLNIKRGD